MTGRTIGGQRRFALLERTGFVCQFCGAKPGNERLHVAHIFPHYRGGTEHDNNLTVACDRCNLGMGTLISVPSGELAGGTDVTGWPIWKRWGDWVLSYLPGGIDDADDAGTVDSESLALVCDLALSFNGKAFVGSYDTNIERIHEDWHEHMARKGWLTTKDLMDLGDALRFARTLICPPEGRP